jgi:hypothetical protein
VGDRINLLNANARLTCHLLSSYKWSERGVTYCIGCVALMSANGVTTELVTMLRLGGNVWFVTVEEARRNRRTPEEWPWWGIDVEARFYD